MRRLEFSLGLSIFLRFSCIQPPTLEPGVGLSVFFKPQDKTFGNRDF